MRLRSLSLRTYLVFSYLALILLLIAGDGGRRGLFHRRPAGPLHGDFGVGPEGSHRRQYQGIRRDSHRGGRIHRQG